ncbi:MAG: MBL fold metallo-hydrolase [Pseudomonadota bacterium]
MRSVIAVLALLAVSCVGVAAAPSGAALNIYYIDTEGGQSTLFVGPGGESLLVDTGNAGERDLARIAETLRTAGVSRIDHMWTTHFHGDHVGAILELAKQFPIQHFYDHGAPNPKDRIVSAAFLTSYAELSQGKRTIVKPGDKVKMSGLDITTVASANQFIRTNLPGGGRANTACADVKPMDESAYFDPDNGESAGFIMSYGKFRTADLGDLTWNGEIDLMCPTNRIGTVDVYLTSHHGLEKSGSPALVHALQPRVAVMNNGTRKGGDANTFRVLFASPGLEDLWQLHWAYNAGLENSPAMFIANVDDNATIAGVLTQAAAPARGAGGPPGAGPGGPGAGAGPGAPGRGAGPVAPGAAAGPGAPGAAGPGGPPARGGGPGAPGGFGGAGGPGGGGAASHTPAYLIKVTAKQDGSFTVTNTRNNFSKTYAPRQ